MIRAFPSVTKRSHSADSLVLSNCTIPCVVQALAEASRAAEACGELGAGESMAWFAILKKLSGFLGFRRESEVRI